MNKLIMFLSISTFALLAFNVQAQDNGVAVGNPESDNLLMIQQDYEVAPTPAMPAQPSANTQPANLQPKSIGSAVVLENVSASETPTTEEINIDESEMEY